MCQCPVRRALAGPHHIFGRRIHRRNRYVAVAWKTGGGSVACLPWNNVGNLRRAVSLMRLGSTGNSFAAQASCLLVPRSRLSLVIRQVPSAAPALRYFGHGTLGITSDSPMIGSLGEAGRGGAREGVYAEAGACVITAGTGILVRHAWRAEGIEFQFAFLCMVSVASCMMSWHVALLFCPLHVGCRLRALSGVCTLLSRQR